MTKRPILDRGCMNHSTVIAVRFFHSLLAPRSFLPLVCVCLLNLCSNVCAQPFSLDDIEFWVGTGGNRAALAIDWDDSTSDPPALVWGFRWDGMAHGDGMLTAVIAADPRLYAKLGGTRDSPTAVFGLGYDASGDGEFALDDGTAFDAQGFDFTSPADLAMSVDEADYYAEGWFTGFWHYGVADGNPFDGGTWSDTPVGMAQRVLTDGSWDSWAFSPTFNFAAFAEKPLAVPAPFQRGDLNRDGRVDSADYEVWRNGFGSISEVAADPNGDGIMDAADYVVWRKSVNAHMRAQGLAVQAPPPNHPLAAESVGSARFENVPEPKGISLLAACLLVLQFLHHTRVKEEFS